MSFNNILYLLKILFLIFIITFSVDKMLFFILNKLSDDVYSGQAIGKLNHYLKIKDEKDLIIFGSSRASHNIDPDKLSKNGFNMGVDARNIAFDLPLIKLLEGNGKEQVILIQIDPYHAFDSKYKGADMQHLRCKYNRNKIIRESIDKIGQNNIFQDIFWCIGYNNKALFIIKNYFKPKYDYKYYNGYDPITVSKKQREIFKNFLKQKEKEEVDTVYCSQDFKLNEKYVIIFNELEQFCRNNNKKLIFFTAPLYIDKCKKDNDELSKIMKSRGFTYYDLTDFFKTNNSIAYWKDDIHLSKEGAQLFTMKIKSILNDEEKLTFNY